MAPHAASQGSCPHPVWSTGVASNGISGHSPLVPLPSHTLATPAGCCLHPLTSGSQCTVQQPEPTLLLPLPDSLRPHLDFQTCRLHSTPCPHPVLPMGQTDHQPAHVALQMRMALPGFGNGSSPKLLGDIKQSRLAC